MQKSTIKVQLVGMRRRHGFIFFIINAVTLTVTCVIHKSAFTVLQLSLTKIAIASGAKLIRLELIEIVGQMYAYHNYA